MRNVDLASPASWFWPATTTLVFAVPDPLLQDRFYTISLIYDERESPIILLVDPDCEHRDAILYDLDEPDSTLPALSMWGKPVVAANGKTFRRMKGNMAIPSEWMHAFCDTEWTAEREAAGAAVFGR